MIVSQNFYIKKYQNLTKDEINSFFEKINIKPIKWAITRVLKNKIQILTVLKKKKLCKISLYMVI